MLGGGETIEGVVCVVHVSLLVFSRNGVRDFSFLFGFALEFHHFDRLFFFNLLQLCTQIFVHVLLRLNYEGIIFHGLLVKVLIVPRSSSDRVRLHGDLFPIVCLVDRVLPIITVIYGFIILDTEHTVNIVLVIVRRVVFPSLPHFTGNTIVSTVKGIEGVGRLVSGFGFIEMSTDLPCVFEADLIRS
jgi:hypothetical protein